MSRRAENPTPAQDGTRRREQIAADYEPPRREPDAGTTAPVGWRIGAADRTRRSGTGNRMPLQNVEHGMRRTALLVAAALLFAGCGAGPDPHEAVVQGEPPAEPAVPAALDRDAAPPPPPPPGGPPPGGAPPPGGVQHCSDVPRLGSRLEGKLSSYQNPDPIVQDVMFTYGSEHPDTFAGMWIDRDSGGVLMLGFTDDPEPHREALLARAPSPDDTAGLDPRPPVTDQRPLGERDDVVIDVVRTRFSEAGMRAVRAGIDRAMDGADYGLDGSGYDIRRQRVTLHLVNPPDGAVARLAQVLPDPSEVCIELTLAGGPPPGPLQALPGDDLDDPVVKCPTYEALPSSQFAHLPSIDEVAHPAVDALRAQIEAPAGEPLPEGRWVVVDIRSHTADFAVLSLEGSTGATLERPYQGSDDGWRPSGKPWTESCARHVPLPPGLARVEVYLDPESPPDPDAASVDVLVVEQGCASGREMGDALKGPQVRETGEAVFVAFAVVFSPGSAACPGNPPASVTVELSEQLGDRTLYDGLHRPPSRLRLPDPDDVAW